MIQKTIANFNSFEHAQLFVKSMNAGAGDRQSYYMAKRLGESDVYRVVMLDSTKRNVNRKS